MWLLGRLPADSLELLPGRLVRPGRAGRGPGPDIREASLLMPSGVIQSGPIEVHLRASDFVRHGHDRDPAYARLLLHVVWEDDVGDVAATLGRPVGTAAAPTVAVGPACGFDPARLRRRLRLGPSGGEPYASPAPDLGADEVRARVRMEGRRRLAERVWAAGRLAELRDWDGAWWALLERALRGSAGRRRETNDQRATLSGVINATLTGGTEQRERGMPDGALRALRSRALAERPSMLIEALGGAGAIGRGRAAEVGWNAALPLLMAAAAAYGDLPLARATATLTDRWPAPRPYGRTAALRALLDATGAPAKPSRRARPRPGALYDQGLLHLQDLWCERGGCGACPLSEPGWLSPPPAGLTHDRGAPSSADGAGAVSASRSA